MKGIFDSRVLLPAVQKSQLDLRTIGAKIVLPKSRYFKIDVRQRWAILYKVGRKFVGVLGHSQGERQCTDFGPRKNITTSTSTCCRNFHDGPRMLHLPSTVQDTVEILRSLSSRPLDTFFACAEIQRHHFPQILARCRSTRSK